MDFVTEAKKFIERATGAHSPDVIKEHLKMADWCLGQAIEERDGTLAGRHANGKAMRPS